jgi:hypothetical protein
VEALVGNIPLWLWFTLTPYIGAWLGWSLVRVALWEPSPDDPGVILTLPIRERFREWGLE